MAPFGTVLKNSILFLIITAGITYAAAQMLMIGLWNLLEGYGISYSTADRDIDTFGAGVRLVWLGLLLLVGGVGVIYMKALSDTVEEGMIEF